MKKKSLIVCLCLLAALLTLACVVGIRTSAWRSERGFTFDAFLSQGKENADPRVKELDEALKRARTERQKIKSVLDARSQEAQDSLINLAQAFKEFDASEREAIKGDFNSGRLSSQYENRADVAKAFVLFQEARTLKNDEKSLRALYDRFDVAIARAESERANILRRAETNELLGVEDDSQTIDQRSELIDRLTALADETTESNARESSVLLPNDLENATSDSDDELLRAAIDASNSNEDVESFLKDAEKTPILEAEARPLESSNEDKPFLNALKSIFAAVVWGGLATLYVFIIGLYFLICPIRKTPNATTPGSAPTQPTRATSPFGVVGFVIFIALALYGLRVAGLPGMIGLGFVGLLNWRAPKIVREYGVLRFELLALIATFFVFLVLIALAIL